MSDFNDYQVRAHAAPWRGGVEFLMRDTETKTVGTDIVMIKVVEGEVIRPTFHLSMEEA